MVRSCQVLRRNSGQIGCVFGEVSVRLLKIVALAQNQNGNAIYVDYINILILLCRLCPYTACIYI